MASGLPLLTREIDDGRRIVFCVTDRTDGDLRVDGSDAALARRRRGVVAHPWTWLDQVHGDKVVVVDEPGAHAGATADAAVTATTGAAIVVHTADCAPIALVGSGGCIGVAHAGWRGLVAGIIPATVDAMRERGAGTLTAVVGPCIHAGCYEFGDADLKKMASAFGDGVRGLTREGTPALDLPAAAVASLEASGVETVVVDERCTGCDPSRFSHRVGQDRGRQALVGWIES